MHSIDIMIGKCGILVIKLSSDFASTTQFSFQFSNPSLELLNLELAEKNVCTQLNFPFSVLKGAKPSLPGAVFPLHFLRVSSPQRSYGVFDIFAILLGSCSP